MHCMWCERQKPHERRFTLPEHFEALQEKLTANPSRGLPIGSLSQPTAPPAPAAPTTARPRQLPDAPAGPSGFAGTTADRAGTSNPAIQARHRSAADETPASHPGQPSAAIQAELAKLDTVIGELHLASLSSGNCKLPKWRELKGGFTDRLRRVEGALVVDLLECIDAPAFMTDLTCSGIRTVRGGSDEMQDDFPKLYTAVRQRVEECARPNQSAAERQHAQVHFRASLRRLLGQMVVWMAMRALAHSSLRKTAYAAAVIKLMSGRHLKQTHALRLIMFGKSTGWAMPVWMPLVMGDR